jgi:phosphate transport system substrate-binding protein
MRILRTCLMASVAMACAGVAGTAQAQTLVPIYGGGATFPSKALRLLMDCYMVQLNAGGNTTADVAAAMLPYDAACNGGAGNGATGLFPADDVPAGGRIGVMLYAPVGSGGGKTAFKTHGMVGAPATGNKIAFTDGRDPRLSFGATGYTGGRLHFIGSDDVVNANDYNVGATSYVVSGNKAKYGEWIQIPELVGPVTIAFNGTDAAGTALPLPLDTHVPPKPILNLSRKSFCGIFSGHITKWTNPSLVADNPTLAGVPAAASAIKVIHRSDGSGTSFLFTNALIEQCKSSTGGHAPFGIDDTSGALVSYAFPWADQNSNFAVPADPNYSCNSPAPVLGGPANALPVEGANLLGWPDFAPTAPVAFAAGHDVCGTVIPNPMAPAPTNVHGASGNGGVELAMDPVTGAAAFGTIGYLTPDFAAPIVPTGLPVANLQNEHDLALGVAGGFIAPSATASATAMASSSPPTAADLSNPLAWSDKLTVPNPAVLGAYPIAGFTNFGFYQCYASADDLNTIFAYLKFHYGAAPNGTHGGSTAAGILANQGFAPVPGNLGDPTTWLGALASLVTAVTPMQIGPAAGVCTAGD